MDGVRLDRLEPGTVREVSAAIASWLIVEGYAVPEMRKQPSEDLNGPWQRRTPPRAETPNVKRRATD